MRTQAMSCVVAVALAGVAMPAFSQEKPAKGTVKPRGMDPQTKAWMEAARPGPNHQLLNYCVGQWQTTVRHWMTPGQESEPGEGICVNEWVLGGRYVKTTYKGSFMNMPFEGLGYTGYDNVTRQFVSTWMDSMGTGIMQQTGTYDPAKKLFTYKSQMLQPTGELVRQIETIRIVDENRHVMTFYHQMPDAEKPVKVMEIVYSRIKKAQTPAAPRK